MAGNGQQIIVLNRSLMLGDFLKFGIGFSSKEDSKSAAVEAINTALKSFRVFEDPVFSMIFTTAGYDQEAVVKTAKELLGNSKFAGICGGGILTSHGMLDQGVGVLTVAGKLKAETTLQICGNTDPREVGETAGRDLLKSGISEGTVFIFPESLSKNISEMITGLYNIMGPDYTYVGGGSGDNFNSKNSYQFTDEGAEEGALAVALVDGLSIKTCLGHGWKPKMVPLIINQVHNKRIFEINGRTAWDIYCEEADTFNPYELKKYGIPNPLGFPDLSGNYLIRDPIEINPDGSMDFITEISRYSVGYLMEADLEAILRNTREVALRTLKSGKKPSFVLVFNCLFRYNIVNREFKEEFDVLKDVFGEDVPIFGVLTFGEVGSYFDVPILQNKSLIITAVYDDMGD